MSDVSAFMLLKVLIIAALGGAFVWWQFRDLAREKERSNARKNALTDHATDHAADDPSVR